VQRDDADTQTSLTKAAVRPAAHMAAELQTPGRLLAYYIGALDPQLASTIETNDRPK